jgi:hypothetical protein
MSEKYIERLQRERGEALDFAKAYKEWHAAMDHLSITGRKGDARKAVDEKRAAMDAALKLIEPMLADKEA